VKRGVRTAFGSPFEGAAAGLPGWAQGLGLPEGLLSRVSKLGRAIEVEQHTRNTP